jgi:hypothetical protein
MEKEEDRARYSSEEEKLAYEQRGDREAAFFCDLELGWKRQEARGAQCLSRMGRREEAPPLLSLIIPDGARSSGSGR